VLEAEGENDVVIVTHGTVLALFAESKVDKRVALWRALASRM